MASLELAPDPCRLRHVRRSSAVYSLDSGMRSRGCEETLLQDFFKLDGVGPVNNNLIGSSILVYQYVLPAQSAPPSAIPILCLPAQAGTKWELRWVAPIGQEV